MKIFYEHLSKNAKITILIIFIIVLHVFYFSINYIRGEYSLGVDGPRYKSLAEEYRFSPTIMGENCKILFWTPWFLIIALLHENPFLVFVFNLICFTLTLYMLYILSRDIKISFFFQILLLILYGLYWPTFDYLLFYHYEIFLTFIFTGVVFSLFTFCERLEKSNMSWILLGLFGGVGIFAHPRSLGVFLLGLAFLIINRKKIRSWGVKIAVYFLFSFLLIFLWGIRNKIVHDRWVFTSDSLGYNLYVGFNPIAQGTFTPQPPYPPHDKAFEMAKNYILTHPIRSSYLVLLKLVKFWYPSESDRFGPKIFLIQEYILIPLALIGFLWALYIKEKSRVIQGIIFIIIYYMLFHAVFYIDLPRFRLPVMPFLCFLSIYSLQNILRAIKS